MLVESDTLSKPILTDFQIYSPLQNTLTKLIPLWYLVALSVRVEGFRSHLHLTVMLLLTKKSYWKRAKGIHQFQLSPLFNSSHFKRKTESKYKGFFDVVCKTQR